MLRCGPVPASGLPLAEWLFPCMQDVAGFVCVPSCDLGTFGEFCGCQEHQMHREGVGSWRACARKPPPSCHCRPHRSVAHKCRRVISLPLIAGWARPGPQADFPVTAGHEIWGCRYSTLLFEYQHPPCFSCWTGEFSCAATELFPCQDLARG